MKSQWPANTGNSMKPRHYQGRALRVCAMRTALTAPNLHARPDGGKGDGAGRCAHPFTSGGAQALGLFIKDLLKNAADEAAFEALKTAQLNVHLTPKNRLLSYATLTDV